MGGVVGAELCCLGCMLDICALFTHHYHCCPRTRLPSAPLTAPALCAPRSRPLRAPHPLHPLPTPRPGPRPRPPPAATPRLHLPQGRQAHGGALRAAARVAARGGHRAAAGGAAARGRPRPGVQPGQGAAGRAAEATGGGQARGGRDAAVRFSSCAGMPRLAARWPCDATSDVMHSVTPTPSPTPTPRHPSPLVLPAATPPC